MLKTEQRKGVEQVKNGFMYSLCVVSDVDGEQEKATKFCGCLFAKSGDEVLPIVSAHINEKSAILFCFDPKNLSVVAYEKDRGKFLEWLNVISEKYEETGIPQVVGIEVEDKGNPVCLLPPHLMNPNRYVM